MTHTRWESRDWNELEDAWICKHLHDVDEFENVLSTLLLRLNYEKDGTSIKRACSLIRKMRLWKETGFRIKQHGDGIECILLQ